ncbi:MAG: hypothetical protein ACLUUO_09955 [Sellimonas intestinalis]
MILEYLKHLKRKWYIFLLAVLVIGGAAYFGQSYLYAKEKGEAGKNLSMSVYRLLNIDGSFTGKHEEPGETLDYDMSLLWTRSTLLSELADSYTENYDMEQVCPGWGNMALKYQVEWIQEQFQLYHVPNSMIYEVRFYKVIAESKQEEIQPVMEEMMNDYIEKAMESVSLVEKDLKYEVAKEKTYIRNQIVEAENTFKVKEFALAGFWEF